MEVGGKGRFNLNFYDARVFSVCAPTLWNNSPNNIRQSTGFVWALEILENPGKFLKPWKSLEKPWNFFIKPWKITQNFIEKINLQNGAFC